MADGTRIVYGLHAVTSALELRRRDIRRAWCLERHEGSAQRILRHRLDDAGIAVTAVGRAELDRLCHGGRHQGFAVEVTAPAVLDLPALESLVTALGRDARLLVLDQVEDPRNLGACLRTADAAGIHCVVVPKARSVKLTPAALKAATGAADTVPLAVVPNLARTLAWLKAAGVWVVGADGEARRSLYEARLAAPVAIVLGAEGSGLRRLTRESCDELVRIPMQGTVASLNVSVAAGVILFELVRQSGGIAAPVR